MFSDHSSPRQWSGTGATSVNSHASRQSWHNLCYAGRHGLFIRYLPGEAVGTDGKDAAMICVPRNQDPLEQLRRSVSYVKGRLLIPCQSIGLAIVAWEGGVRARRIRRAMVHALGTARVATCDFDLLPPSGWDDPAVYDDQDLIATRLTAAVDHLSARPGVQHLPMVLVAGGRAAAAAAVVAAQRPHKLRALVCCAGDVQASAIDPSAIDVPTMLVVPCKHSRLIESNEQFFWSLTCTSQIAMIRGANRHFREPGALLACEKVVTQWCTQHLEQHPDLADDQPESRFASRN